MENLWAPWRMEYILGEKSQSCVFCVPDKPEDDEKNLIVHRGRLVFVMLNRYPYASGHLMVIPFRHLGDITELSPEEAMEFTAVTQLCCHVLRHSLHPEGINVGINLGQAAGAGIKDHLHQHVVPRWIGDSQFIAVLDEVRVIPEHLQSTCRKLRPVFAEMACDHDLYRRVTGKG